MSAWWRRSRSLWLAALPPVFLAWAWVDSMSHQVLAGWDGPVSLQVAHWAGELTFEAGEGAGSGFTWGSERFTLPGERAETWCPPPRLARMNLGTAGVTGAAPYWLLTALAALPGAALAIRRLGRSKAPA